MTPSFNINDFFPSNQHQTKHIRKLQRIASIWQSIFTNSTTNMSEFSGYEKMPNSIKKLGLDASDFSHMEKLTWVVTEKIHGANFSFVYEKGRLRFAKRKEYLSWKDDFFGFQLVVNRMEDPIIRLFEDLSAQIKGNKFIIYGELFGGKYPHPDVAPAEKLHPIQTGVYYSPNTKIYICPSP